MHLNKTYANSSIRLLSIGFLDSTVIIFCDYLNFSGCVGVFFPFHPVCCAVVPLHQLFRKTFFLVFLMWVGTGLNPLLETKL